MNLPKDPIIFPLTTTSKEIFGCKKRFYLINFILVAERYPEHINNYFLNQKIKDYFIIPIFFLVMIKY